MMTFAIGGLIGAAARKTPLANALPQGRGVAALLFLLALAACATTRPPSPQPIAQAQCLPMADYSRTEEAKAADELKALPPGSELARFVIDYGQLRAASRALCGAGK